MSKSILLCYFLFICSFTFAQNSIVFKGRVIDQITKLPIESATVYLTREKDSSVVNYTITNKTGNFNFKVKKGNESVSLKISYISYQDFKEKLTSLEADKDFGTIQLNPAVNVLNEVVIKNEIPPIRIKKDTLEFNATSFKVGADANVEALLKQLPGVEITPEGKITVNGKEVSNVLVNGKPFFGKDGKIATQNLPAEIIDKVQVVATKTKAEKISGESGSSNDKTINLTIQKGKDKGFFGKVVAGYGSDKRYESSLLLNYFKGDRKFSILASSNNINSVGFSMDEVFDNMGGGRNKSISYSDNGSFGINNMSFGNNGSGITQSNMIGLNYQDQWTKKVEVDGNYYFSNAETENTNRTQTINLLPTSKTITNSSSFSKNRSNNHNLSFESEIKIDSTLTLSINPRLLKSFSNNRFSSSKSTKNEQNIELNSSTVNNETESENSEFATEASLVKLFKKKKRALVVNVITEYKNKNDFENINSATLFYDSTLNDVRKQNSFQRIKNEETKLEVRYGEPLTDSLRLSLTAEINSNRMQNSINTFNFNTTTNDFTDFNSQLSNLVKGNALSCFSSSGIILDKDKFNGRINLGPEFVQFDAQSNYLGMVTDRNKYYVFPKIKGYINYDLGKSKSIYANYDFYGELPQPDQVLPFENLSNPLNTIVGNENLKPMYVHNFYGSFNNYDYENRSGFYLYSGFYVKKNAVVSSTLYDANFKSTTTYENTDLNYNTYFGGNWNKSFKKEKRTLRFGFSFSTNYTFDQGFINNVQFESRTFAWSPRVNVSWSIDQLITISPVYKYTNNTSQYKNYLINVANNFLHNAKIEITTYWPKNLVIGNDFGYTYNSNIADGFKKDFYLWNTSIGFNFYKKQFLVKVKVYDVLNQNQNTSRNITSTAIIDAENTVLKRYVMFSLTYKLEKFAGKKKANDAFFIED
jgi:hypothetical protein